jgi:plastocyanin
MQKKLLAVVPAVAAVIVLAAIFGMDTKDSARDTTSEAGSNTVSITMSSSRPGCESSQTCYVPFVIAVYRGQSVTWVNDDSAFHTVTSGYYDEHDGLFDSGQLDPAKTFSHTFNNEGNFDYYCKLHPWMKGIVVIRPA